MSLTIGWTLYATAVDGWMILLSRLLIGTFIGIHYTLTYAYFGERFEDYVAAQKELDNYGKRQASVKDVLFALHGIAMYLAYIVGLGKLNRLYIGVCYISVVFHVLHSLYRCASTIHTL